MPQGLSRPPRLGTRWAGWRLGQLRRNTGWRRLAAHIRCTDELVARNHRALRAHASADRAARGARRCRRAATAAGGPRASWRPPRANGLGRPRRMNPLADRGPCETGRFYLRRDLHASSDHPHRERAEFAPVQPGSQSWAARVRLRHLRHRPEQGELVGATTRWFSTEPPTRYVAKLGVDLPGLLVSIRMTAFLS